MIIDRYYDFEHLADAHRYAELGHSQGKVVITIQGDPFVIKKILSHLGLCPQPPPIAPARYQEDIEDRKNNATFPTIDSPYGLA